VADDLNTPLGQDRKRKRWKLPRLMPWATAGALGLCLMVFVGWAAVVDDPLGGEPIVLVSTEPRAPAKAADDATPKAKAEPEPTPETTPGSAEPKPAAGEPPKTPPPGMQSVTIIDGGTGTRQEVMVPAQGGPGGAVDPKLLESTRH